MKGWKKELRDQSAHGAVVIAAMVPAVFWPSPVTCAIGGFAIGLLAEVKERGSTVTRPVVERALRSWRDLCGYTAFGLAIGIAHHCLR